MMGVGVGELVVMGLLCLGGLVLVGGAVVLVYVLKKKKGEGGQP